MNAAQIANGVTIRNMQALTSSGHDGGGILAWATAIIFGVIFLLFLYWVYLEGR